MVVQQQAQLQLVCSRPVNAGIAPSYSIRRLLSAALFQSFQAGLFSWISTFKSRRVARRHPLLDPEIKGFVERVL